MNGGGAGGRRRGLGEDFYEPVVGSIAIEAALEHDPAWVPALHDGNDSVFIEHKPYRCTADVVWGAEELAPIPGSFSYLYDSQGVAAHNQTDARTEDSWCGHVSGIVFGNCGSKVLNSPPGLCAGVVNP